MAAFTVRVGVLLVFVCGVVFTSWKIDVLLAKQDSSPDRKGIKITSSNSGIIDDLTTKTVTGGGNLQSRNLTNVKDGQILVSQTNDSSQTEIKTFFTAVKTTFKDVPILQDRCIPTLKFLDACLNAVHILKSMKRTIFDRVVSDVQGNIKKIHDNYNVHPDESYYLQDMVMRDIEQLHALNNDKDSRQDYFTTSTILALQWLVRAFRFISRFNVYITEGEDQIQSANKAYDETLKKHHGFLARAFFKTAFSTLSTRPDFLKEFALNEADFARPDFEAKFIADSRDYFIALDERLKIIEGFFLQHGIEI